MARIPFQNESQVEPRLRAILDHQKEKWGAPLMNHLIYSRRPSIFAAARGMWHGLAASGLLSEALVALVNRRVAYLNHCPF